MKRRQLFQFASAAAAAAMVPGSLVPAAAAAAPGLPAALLPLVFTQRWLEGHMRTVCFNPNVVPVSFLLVRTGYEGRPCAFNEVRRFVRRGHSADRGEHGSLLPSEYAEVHPL